jgi:ABC-type transporter Mla subunit MlaD
MNEIIEQLSEVIDVTSRAFEERNKQMRSLVAQLLQVCRQQRDRMNELEDRIETLERGF